MNSKRIVATLLKFVAGIGLSSVLVGLATIVLPSGVHAQTIPWDRNIKASDIQISPGGAGGAGATQIMSGGIVHVVATFRVSIIDSTAAHENLNTIVRLTVDGGQPQDHSVNVVPSGASGWGYCRTECLTCGAIECNQLDIPQPPYDFCACAVKCVTSFDLVVSPGDALHFALLPAPGAQTDAYTADDSVSVVAFQAVPATNPGGIAALIILSVLFGCFLLSNGPRNRRA